MLRKIKVKYTTVPSLAQMVSGRFEVTNLRAFETEDLLSRPIIRIGLDNLRDYIEHRVVLVTGAGGLLPAELSQRIHYYNPKKLVLIDRAEGLLTSADHELRTMGYHNGVVARLADVSDKFQMRRLFEEHRPEIIFHAASYKSVPMLERNPGEAVRNNVLGTACLAELAVEFGVKNFVLVSSDKVINPANVVGATRRLAEMLVQSHQSKSPDGTQFMTVRLGNVLGSSNCVVAIFQKQIAAGGPVQITDRDMTRHVMLMSEAVDLVLYSSAYGVGGEIYAMDTGEPVKVDELARRLIELNGFKPEVDIPIEFVGMRPGEKLHEELYLKGAELLPTSLPQVLRYAAPPVAWEQMQQHLQRLRDCLAEPDPDRIKQILQQAVPEYRT
jgi:FlaA1/EpsC-like NDP-sugar epimerase